VASRGRRKSSGVRKGNDGSRETLGSGIMSVEVAMFPYILEYIPHVSADAHNEEG
jgi:hypothetical protein